MLGGGERLEGRLVGFLCETNLGFAVLHEMEVASHEGSRIH